MYWIRFLVGICLGSFVHCMAYRSAVSMHGKRSVCPTCGHVLAWYELIPLYSYLREGGRCRYCHTRIPLDVFLAELSTGIVCMCKFPTGIWLILLFLTIHDLYSMMIPDWCHVVLMLLWIGQAWNTERLLEGIFMVVLLCLLAWLMYRYKGEMCIGGGDIKLIGVCTLYLGMEEVWLQLLLSSSLALVYILNKKKRTIPFGPFLSIIFYLLFITGGRCLV